MGLHKRLMPYSHSTEDRRLLARLELVLGSAANTPLFGASDTWTVAAKAEIQAMEPAQQAAWRELIALARTALAKPSKKWLKEARARVDRVGADSFRNAMRRWLPLFDRPEDRDSPDAPNLDVLRGLVFAATLVADPSLPPLLGGVAERAYRKIPVIGVMAAKVGNACVVSLGELGTPRGDGTAQPAQGAREGPVGREGDRPRARGGGTAAPEVKELKKTARRLQPALHESRSFYTNSPHLLHSRPRSRA